MTQVTEVNNATLSETDARPWPLVHWKADAGRALCTDYALPGEWLVEVEAEVTCRECIEWRHA